MESTSVFWIPVFQVLETHGLDVILVNAQHVKNVPGRKTDVSDCQWLQYLHSVGLLSASFRPPDAICAVRTLVRHRANLVEQAATFVQLMQKSLVQMNLRLTSVLSDISGQTGLRIIDAILAGERNPQVLSKMRDPRVHASSETIALALQGDWRDEHLFTLRQARSSYQHTQDQLRACDAEIDQRVKALSLEANPEQPQPPALKPNSTGGRVRALPARDEGMRAELYRLLGVDLTQIPGMAVTNVMTLVSELGPNLTAFPTERHFCNWLGLCPNPQISGGRVLKRGTRKVKGRAATTFRLAAATLHHQKNALGAYYRKMRAALGAPKAITAAAHRLARIYYLLLTTQKEYDESKFAQAEAREHKRRVDWLVRNAEELGYTVHPKQQPPNETSLANPPECVMVT